MTFEDCFDYETAYLLLEVEIRNIGPADADLFEVAIDGFPAGLTVEDGLGAGQSRSLETEWYDLGTQELPFKEAVLTVSIDSLDEVFEGDESNNESELRVSIPAGMPYCPTPEPTPEPPDEGGRLATPLLRPGQALNLVSLEMIDERNGWGVAGEDGSNYHVLRTEDGGRTWIDVSPPELVSQVEGFGKPGAGTFIDRATAWVSYHEVNIDRRVPGSIHLWKTDDGGRTWQYSAIVHRSPYYLDSDSDGMPSVSFVDAQYGWAKVIDIWQPRCGEWELFRTVDGGATWQYLAEELFVCGDSGLDFLGRNHIWRTEGSTRDLVPDLILSQSHDGGLSWETSSLPLPGEESVYWECRVSSPSLVTPTTGEVEVACTTDEGATEAYAYRTENSGLTWQITPIEFSQAEHLSPSIAWRRGPAAVEGETEQSKGLRGLFWTFDAGRTWSWASTLDWDGDLDFVSSLVGWGVAENAEGRTRLLMTVDGGRSWEEIKPVVAGGATDLARPAPSRVSLPSELQPIRAENVSSLEILQALPAESVSTLAFLPPWNVLITGHKDGKATFWLLDGRSYPSVTRLHSDWIYAIAGSEEERMFASASKDGALKIWDFVGVGESARIAGFWGEVSTVAVAPGGQVLASGSADGVIRTWSLLQDYPEGAAKAVRIMEGHSAWVWEVAFAPDGRTLASGSSDRTVRVWDVESGMELAGPLIHEATVGSVAFSPDGRRLASGTWDGVISLWDTETWQVLSQPGDHESRVHVVRFAPGGSLLASGAADGSLILWSVENGEPLRILQAGQGAVRSLAFSPDGSLLVTSSDDGMLRFWGVRP